ncbi:MAG: translation elongation factor Ts [Bacteroidales bacterium]|nr:translation elongation factor Ts [Bacteroidales bacterium]
MANITAADVMKLRKMTSAGMMDCKNALIEADGDFQKAVDIIREKGKMVAAKRADRETSEGAVVARIEGNKAILVALGCETDFVARTEGFQSLVEALADVAMKNFPADTDALRGCTMPDGESVEKEIEVFTGKTGEKLSIVYYGKIEAPYIYAYIHKLTGKLGAIVGFNKTVDETLAKGIAMQVASMNPVAISPEAVLQDMLDNEFKVAVQKTKDELVQKAIDAALNKAGINPAHVDSEAHIESNTAKGWLTPEQADQAREIIKTVGEQKAASLPAPMVEGIAKGRVQKFLKESTLSEQDYQMADEKISVKDAIAKADKEAKVVDFKRVSLSD